MSNTQQIKTHNTKRTVPTKTSALDRFNLGYEYNLTLTQIKQSIRARTI